MKYIKLFITAFAILAFSEVLAQNVNYQQQYLQGKDLFNQGEYALARETFKPVIPKDPSNPFAEYATFYSALAAYYDGYPAAAREMLLQARERFPNWSRMDDVYYWLAKIYFENEDAYLALNAVNNIESTEVREDARTMAYHYLYLNHDVYELSSFYKDYPNQPSLGRVLAEKIADQPIELQDKELLNELIRKFDLNPDDFLVSRVEKAVFKDTYRMAVLLPFMLEDLNPNDRRRPNQFVLDFYQGLRMAVDRLRAEGKSIELYAYDTRRDSVTTQEILDKKELKTMDLIVGPLYPQPARMVSRFALENKINMVNPLSNSVEYTGNNPYVFLFNPSVATIGEVAADYTYDSFGEGPGLVIFGDTKNDRVMAEAFADQYNERGGELLMVRQIEKDNSREILDILLKQGAMIKDIARESEEQEEATLSIPRDSLSFIFVASENSLIFSKVVSAVDTRGDDVKILGSAGWLDIPVVKYEVFERLHTHFYAPSYVSVGSEAYQEFRNVYIQKHRTVPSEYAAKGYELGMFFGESMDKYGKYPQVSWDDNKRQPGVLMPGYQFARSQDNQLVPFLEFGEEGLELIIREREINEKEK